MFKNDWSEHGNGYIVETDNANVYPLNQLEPVPFVGDEEDCRDISEDEILTRGEAMGALGQAQAEYLLENPGEIPEEWKGLTIFFPGTVWGSLSPSGRFILDRFIPALSMSGEYTENGEYKRGDWYMYLWELDGILYAHQRFLRPRKEAQRT